MGTLMINLLGKVYVAAATVALTPACIVISFAAEAYAAHVMADEGLQAYIERTS